MPGGSRTAAEIDDGLELVFVDASVEVEDVVGEVEPGDDGDGCKEEAEQDGHGENACLCISGEGTDENGRYGDGVHWGLDSGEPEGVATWCRWERGGQGRGCCGWWWLRSGPATDGVGCATHFGEERASGRVTVNGELFVCCRDVMETERVDTIDTSS